MTHLSLFSGIGGIDLAAHWAGFTTVGLVESEPFCQAVLQKHFPHAPIHDDITTFNAEPFYGVTLVTGGFPCQDISSLNQKGKGLKGERSRLWFDMLRVIEQARPAYVLAENVASFVQMGIDTCLLGLENLGYAARPVIIPAASVGAIHRRRRIFIVGKLVDPDTNDHDAKRRNIRSANQTRSDHQPLARLVPHADTASMGRHKGGERKGSGDIQPAARSAIKSGDWREWNIEPLIRRGDDGVSRRMDKARLKALGNAVVPHQVLPILEAIAADYHNDRKP